MSRRDRPSTMTTTWLAHRKTGKYSELRAQLETHTSLLYTSKILSFFSRKESELRDAITKYWQKPPEPRSGSQPARHKWATLYLIFLNFFGLSQGWRPFLRARDQNVDNFRRSFCHVETWVCWHHISNCASDVLAPHKRWTPHSCPFAPPLNLALFKRVAFVTKNRKRQVHNTS